MRRRGLVEAREALAVLGDDEKVHRRLRFVFLGLCVGVNITYTNLDLGFHTINQTQPKHTHLRGHVMEGEAGVVLVDDLGGDLLARDFVEERDGAGVRLGLLLLSSRLRLLSVCVQFNGCVNRMIRGLHQKLGRMALRQCHSPIHAPAWPSPPRRS